MDWYPADKWGSEWRRNNSLMLTAFNGVRVTFGWYCYQGKNLNAFIKSHVPGHLEQSGLERGMFREW
jgi:hypothetical protein